MKSLVLNSRYSRGWPRLIAALIPAVLMSRCSGILVKPHIDSVKSIAVVSVYMNRDFYNVNETQESGDMATNILKGTVGKKISEKLAEKGVDVEHYRRKIVENGHDTIVKVLASAPGWEVIPTEKAANNERIAAMLENTTKAEDVKNTSSRMAAGLATLANKLSQVGHGALEGQYISYPGLKIIPISSFHSSTKTIRLGKGGAKSSEEKVREILASMAEELGVDAVAVVELDMGYRHGKIAKLTIGRLSMATPVVKGRVAMVTRAGAIAMNTATFGPAEGKRMLMVQHKRVVFNEKGEEIAKNYNVAVGELADYFKEKLHKAIAKL